MGQVKQGVSSSRGQAACTHLRHSPPESLFDPWARGSGCVPSQKMSTDAECSNSVTRVQAKQARSFRLVSAWGDNRKPMGRAKQHNAQTLGW